MAPSRAFLDHDSGVVSAQVAVDGKTNEITIVRPACRTKVCGLDEVLITADALHAQREHAAYLHGRGAHYLVTVKGNQPGQLRQLRSLPWKDVPDGDLAERPTIKPAVGPARLSGPRPPASSGPMRRGLGLRRGVVPGCSRGARASGPRTRRARCPAMPR